MHKHFNENIADLVAFSTPKQQKRKPNLGCKVEFM